MRCQFRHYVVRSIRREVESTSLPDKTKAQYLEIMRVFVGGRGNQSEGYLPMFQKTAHRCFQRVQSRKGCRMCGKGYSAELQGLTEYQYRYGH